MELILKLYLYFVSLTNPNPEAFHTHAWHSPVWLLWGSKDNLQWSNLSFLHVDSGDQTQAISLGSRCLTHWTFSQTSVFIFYVDPTVLQTELKAKVCDKNPVFIFQISIKIIKDFLFNVGGFSQWMDRDSVFNWKDSIFLQQNK